MKVLNVAGFDVKFEKDGRMYYVPNDHRLHLIPDKCYTEDDFQGLLRVIVPPIPVKKAVKEINKSKKNVDVNDPTIKEVVIENIEKKKSKPLAGKRIKSSIRKKHTSKKKTNKGKKTKTEKE